MGQFPEITEGDMVKMTLDMVSLISCPVGIWTRGVALRKGKCRPREQRAGNGRMKPGARGPEPRPEPSQVGMADSEPREGWSMYVIPVYLPCVSHIFRNCIFPLFSLFPLGYFLLTCFQFTYSSSVSHILLNPFIEFLLSFFFNLNLFI